MDPKYEPNSSRQSAHLTTKHILSTNILAIWCEEPSRWKRPWCWESWRARGEGEDRGWDGWMASLTQQTGVWGNSGRWWRTGKPGVLQSTGWQRVGHDWVPDNNSGLMPNSKGLRKSHCLPLAHHCCPAMLPCKHDVMNRTTRCCLSGKDRQRASWHRGHHLN